MKTILAMTTALALVCGAAEAGPGFTGGVRPATGDVNNNKAADECELPRDKVARPGKPAGTAPRGAGGAGKANFSDNHFGPGRPGCPQAQRSQSKPKPKPRPIGGTIGQGSGSGKPN
jgi:hypothetical protein